MRAAVETGAKRVFAIALDWPGLARAAKTEEAALAALAEYVPRYRRSVGAPAKGIQKAAGPEGIEVVARLPGGSGTDYGVPSAIADFDREPLDAAELKLALAQLRGAWSAFESADHRAQGHALAKGPRGGGRDLDKIREHVYEAERAYIGAIGAKAPPASAARSAVEAAYVEAVEARLRGELPERGPRGGERWPARYAIRRAAWHALDHAWEIEDRSTALAT